MAEHLTAAIDQATGCAVLFDASNDIKLIVPNGKMSVVRLGQECDHCTSESLRFAEAVARAWNANGVAARPATMENDDHGRVHHQPERLPDLQEHTARTSAVGGRIDACGLGRSSMQLRHVDQATPERHAEHVGAGALSKERGRLAIGSGAGGGDPALEPAHRSEVAELLPRIDAAIQRTVDGGGGPENMLYMLADALLKDAHGVQTSDGEQRHE